jgi:hypothetical protein
MRVIYQADNCDYESDLYRYEIKMTVDDDGQVWVEGSGGAGTIFAKNEQGGGTRSGSVRRRLDPKFDKIGDISAEYRIHLEIDDPKMNALEQELRTLGFCW